MRARSAVDLDEALRIGRDLLLQVAAGVNAVYREAHLLVDVPVGESGRQQAAVEQIDAAHVEAALREGEERVEELPARVGEVDDRRVVGVAGLREGEQVAAVLGPDDVAEPRRLHDVAELGVDDEALYDARGVELEGLGGPAGRGERGSRPLEGGPLPLLDVVVDERVVHVVADRADGAEIERPVAVHPQLA